MHGISQSNNKGVNIVKENCERQVYSQFRTNDILVHGFDEVLTLVRYLYMNEEHHVVVDNGLCKMELTMTPSLKLMARNLNFPDLPAMNRPFEWTEMLAAIEQLKLAPAVEYPDCFKNRWEEVQSICAHNMTLNLV